MIVRQLDSCTSTPRYVCSHHGFFQEQALLGFDITRLFSVEWVINSDATIALKDENDQLICYLSGNGKLQDLNVVCTRPVVESIHETTDDDTFSIIITVGKKNA